MTAPATAAPGSSAILLMGVCGAGKTTGERLAERLGVPFVEADRLHPPANVAKMSAGHALTDADRAPWLDAVAAEARALAGPGGVVIACSALKRSYRARLAAVLGPLRLVHLSGAPELLRRRMAARRGHFMPPSLLDSQLATLEPPAADEAALVVDVAENPAAIVERLVADLTRPAPARQR